LRKLSISGVSAVLSGTFFPQFETRLFHGGSSSPFFSTHRFGNALAALMLQTADNGRSK
jgi:hypothetical protein